MLTRRLFLGGLLTAGACAPAIVRSGVLMPVKRAIIVPHFGFDLAGGPDFTREQLIRFVQAQDPLGQRGWVRTGWTVGPPILNEHWMR